MTDRFPYTSALDWELKKPGNYAPKTRQLVAFEKSVESLLSNIGMELKILIAILLCHRREFQGIVFRDLDFRRSRRVGEATRHPRGRCCSRG